MSNQAKLNEAAALVKKIAANSKSRKSIITNMSKKFVKLGGGVFRVVFNVDGVAVKIRRAHPKNEWNCFEQEDCDRANKDEYNAYEALAENYPSLAMCALKPTYLKLGNGHDAILMPLVSVLGEDEEWENGPGEVFSKNMKAQYDFIQSHFRDAHDNNIGWSVEEDRVWVIDLNLSHSVYDQAVERRAMRLMKKKKAA